MIISYIDIYCSVVQRHKYVSPDEDPNRPQKVMVFEIICSSLFTNDLLFYLYSYNFLFILSYDLSYFLYLECKMSQY